VDGAEEIAIDDRSRAAETATSRYATVEIIRESRSTIPARVLLIEEIMDARPSRRQLVATLLGESLREIAVLVVVFAPLDAFAQGAPLTVRLWLAIIVGVATLFASGVYLETR